MITDTETPYDTDADATDVDGAAFSSIISVDGSVDADPRERLNRTLSAKSRTELDVINHFLVIMRPRSSKRGSVRSFG